MVEQRKAGQVRPKKAGTPLGKKLDNIFKVYAPAAEELNNALKSFDHLRGQGSGGTLLSPQDAFRPLDWIM